MVLKPLLVTALLSAEPSPEELLRNHYRSSELTVIIGLEDRTLLPGVRRAMERHRLLRSSNVRVLEAARVTEADLRGSVAVIGSAVAVTNAATHSLLAQLPLRDDAVFREGDFLQLLYPNPKQPSHPVFLFAGGSDEDTLSGLEARRNAELHVRRHGKTVFLGFFHDDWTFDSERSRAFEPPARAELDSPHFTFYLHGVPAEEARAFKNRLERVRSGLGDSDAGLELDLELDVHVYPSLEHKGLVTGNTKPAHVEGRTLHAVFQGGWRPEVLLATMGDAAAAQDAQAEGLGYRLAYDADTVAYLDELATRLVRYDNDIALDDPSQYAREALTASLASHPPAHGVSLEQAWRQSLSARNGPKTGSASFPAPPETFLRGVNFTQEGFAIHDGYLSRSAEASLDKLADIGANAVAVVPYAFMRNPHDPGSFVLPEGPGAETDEGVVHALRAAKRHGMTVMLKPQIWIRRSWPGDIYFESAEDTATFFEIYRRWIRHYALLADRYDVEIFAMGTELARLSGGNEVHWRTLVHELRALYRGRLVYAANWGDEVEDVVFWPLVDYVGVDFYYPLSSEPEPSDEALHQAFDRSLQTVRAISERHQKPVLLTEVGYASTPNPWIQPHASDRDAAAAPQAQARAYEAAFRAMADEGPWLRGAFWWKWPTTLQVGGPEDRTFTPNGKPAEEVLRHWFEKLNEAPAGERAR